MTSSWFAKTERSWLESLAIRILKQGKIPRHIAFIMDGNRRYAQKKHLNKIDGHVHGFDKLTQTLEWCHDLGIEEVTIYAFSVENFKRSDQEVEGLMRLAREKFRKLLQEKEELNKRGVCVRVWGDLSLLPIDIQQMIAETMQFTKNNTSNFLNVCFAYTSRIEITAAAKDVMEGVDEDILYLSDVTESLIEECLYTRNNHPDLVIRTSGEVRLSDYLLWQSSYSVIAFIHVLWPEFTIWDLMRAVLYYQMHEKSANESKAKYLDRREKALHDDLAKHFQLLDEDNISFEDYILNYQKRRDQFLQSLSEKRDCQLDLMIKGKTEQLVPPTPEPDVY